MSATKVQKILRDLDAIKANAEEIETLLAEDFTDVDARELAEELRDINDRLQGWVKTLSICA